VVGALLSLRAAASILSRLLIPWMVRALGRVRLIAVSAPGRSRGRPGDGAGHPPHRQPGRPGGHPAAAGLVAGAAGIAAAFWMLGGVLALAAAAVARQPG
jgi:hypothetical protein